MGIPICISIYVCKIDRREMPDAQESFDAGLHINKIGDEICAGYYYYNTIYNISCLWSAVCMLISVCAFYPGLQPIVYHSH